MSCARSLGFSCRQLDPFPIEGIVLRMRKVEIYDDPRRIVELRQGRLHELCTTMITFTSEAMNGTLTFAPDHLRRVEQCLKPCKKVALDGMGLEPT